MHRFIFRLVLFLILFGALDSLPGVWWLVQATKAVVVFLLSALGIDFMDMGDYILHNGTAFFIDWDCTGWKSMYFFLMLVLSAEPSPKSLKALAFLPVLYAFNILRIILLLWLAGMPYWKALHQFLFGYASIIIAVALWILWRKVSDGGILRP